MRSCAPAWSVSTPCPFAMFPHDVACWPSLGTADCRKSSMTLRELDYPERIVDHLTLLALAPPRSIMMIGSGISIVADPSISHPLFFFSSAISLVRPMATTERALRPRADPHRPEFAILPDVLLRRMLLRAPCPHAHVASMSVRLPSAHSCRPRLPIVLGVVRTRAERLRGEEYVLTNSSGQELSLMG